MFAISEPIIVFCIKFTCVSNCQIAFPIVLFSISIINSFLYDNMLLGQQSTTFLELSVFICIQERNFLSYVALCSVKVINCIFLE